MSTYELSEYGESRTVLIRRAAILLLLWNILDCGESLAVLDHDKPCFASQFQTGKYGLPFLSINGRETLSVREVCMSEMSRRIHETQGLRAFLTDENERYDFSRFLTYNKRTHNKGRI